MNDRLTTALGVLLAMALIIGLFVRPPEPDDDVSRPTSADAGPHGLLGVWRWLEHAGVPAQSLRTRYTDLPVDDEGGSLLVAALPQDRAARGDEITHLLDWVSSGNTLLLLVALDDTPEWSKSASGPTLFATLERLTGIGFETVTDPAGDPVMLGSASEEMEIGFEAGDLTHPLTDGVARVVAVTDGLTSIWQPAGEADAGSVLLRTPGTGAPAGWVSSRGRGHVILLASGSLFSNGALGEADNARLFANLVRWHVARGGRVIFDDLHQGLSALYDPEAFYSDRRLGLSMLFVLGFWFVYMVGSHNRLLPLKPSEPVPVQGDFVRAMGGFLARKLTPHAAARLMLDGWFDALRRRGALPPDEPPFACLARNPLVAADDRRALERYHARAEAGGHVDLADLHDCITRTERALG
jgi:hypothetical protein